jgi:hypothetical protein
MDFCLSDLFVGIDELSKFRKAIVLSKKLSKQKQFNI